MKGARSGGGATRSAGMDIASRCGAVAGPRWEHLLLQMSYATDSPSTCSSASSHCLGSMACPSIIMCLCRGGRFSKRVEQPAHEGTTYRDQRRGEGGPSRAFAASAVKAPAGAHPLAARACSRVTKRRPQHWALSGSGAQPFPGGCRWEQEARAGIPSASASRVMRAVVRHTHLCIRSSYYVFVALFALPSPSCLDARPWPCHPRCRPS